MSSQDKDFDCFIQSLEILGIILSLLAYSQPLGIAVGAAIIGYLCLIVNDDENDEEQE
ncbi:MAG: hypothetical protein Fur006_68610 [Coleofasciculaceae cyanobacterium]